MIRFIIVIYFLSADLTAQPRFKNDSDSNFQSSSISLLSINGDRNDDYNFVENVFNRIYFGTAQDMLIYRYTLLKSENTMGLGMVRASIPLEQNIHLLMFQEYIYKAGMMQQTFQLTPYIGIRKRF